MLYTMAEFVVISSWFDITIIQYRGVCGSAVLYAPIYTLFNRKYRVLNKIVLHIIFLLIMTQFVEFTDMSTWGFHDIYQHLEECCNYEASALAFGFFYPDYVFFYFASFK